MILYMWKWLQAVKLLHIVKWLQMDTFIASYNYLIFGFFFGKNI